MPLENAWEARRRRPPLDPGLGGAAKSATEEAHDRKERVKRCGLHRLSLSCAEAFLRMHKTMCQRSASRVRDLNRERAERMSFDRQAGWSKELLAGRSQLLERDDHVVRVVNRLAHGEAVGTKGGDEA